MFYNWYDMIWYHLDNSKMVDTIFFFFSYIAFRTKIMSFTFKIQFESFISSFKIILIHRVEIPSFAFLLQFFRNICRLVFTSEWGSWVSLPEIVTVEVLLAFFNVLTRLYCTNPFMHFVFACSYTSIIIKI